MEEKLKERIDLEKLETAIEKGEEFEEKEKKIDIFFNGSDVVVIKIISYVITEKFAEENEEKLKELGILK